MAATETTNCSQALQIPSFQDTQPYWRVFSLGRPITFYRFTSMPSCPMELVCYLFICLGVAAAVAFCWGAVCSIVNPATPPSYLIISYRLLFLLSSSCSPFLLLCSSSRLLVMVSSSLSLLLIPLFFSPLFLCFSEPFAQLTRLLQCCAFAHIFPASKARVSIF